MAEIRAKIENGNLVITLPIGKPTASASGKTLVVASTRGNVKTDLMVEGHPVTIGVNAYIKI
jgi:hypothetical protein